MEPISADPTHQNAGICLLGMPAIPETNLSVQCISWVLLYGALHIYKNPSYLHST